MNCEICDKRFTGIECFKQHEASEKHKKKVLQQSNVIASNTSPILPEVLSYPVAQNLNSIPCHPCSKIFYTLSDFTRHSVSEEHANMVLKKRLQAVMSADDDVVMCDSTDSNAQAKCGIFEANPPDSVSPMSKESALSLNRSGMATPYYSRCDACDKNFSGPEPYQQHIDSFAHKKKCGLIDIPSLPLAEAPKTVSPSALFCKLCDKTFSGPDNYQQHVVSDKHRKKVLASSNNVVVDSKDNASTTLNGFLHCEICDMWLTGPIPYDQHLKGEAHKKNVSRKQFLKQIDMGKENSQVEIDSNLAGKQIEKSLPPSWYCEICDISCSGPAPYRQHMVSNAHAKNSMKKQAHDKIKEINNLMSVHPESGTAFPTQMSPSAELDLVNAGSGSTAASNADLGETIKESLFGESLKLSTVSPDNLNVTFFNVSEEIDFDKMLKNNLKIRESSVCKEDDDDDAMEENGDDIMYDEMPSP